MAFIPLEKGQLASVVTALRMTKRPNKEILSKDTDILDVDRKSYSLELWEHPKTDSYRDLFIKIGSPWLWFSRLELNDTALNSLITHPEIEIYRLIDSDNRIVAMVELDFRQKDKCEIVFFGLENAYIGKRLGHPMMVQTLKKAWKSDIHCVWLHSCSFDHPAALAFYQKHHFHPYQRMIEIHDDPRLIGLLPKEAAPHIPIID
ncbi:GNAT family N-acetyltransferase [Zymomonas sp.]|uniref:GNAT family N-acetyltransferase n=1 Tax=Zymomonas sp. TaxID=2068624 RepID=UPI0025D9B992|nr:GNAT family N-acetyltransferase [Zymomonas sp.]MCA1955909.1 GNAT family N-acetyltransferase [Zymomonas sp.]